MRGDQEVFEEGGRTPEEVESSARGSGKGLLIKAEDLETGEIISAAHMTERSDFVIFTGPQFYISSEGRYPGTGTTQLTIQKRP